MDRATSASTNLDTNYSTQIDAARASALFDQAVELGLEETASGWVRMRGDIMPGQLAAAYEKKMAKVAEAVILYERSPLNFSALASALIEGKGNLDTQSPQGMTALHLAIVHNRPAEARRLIEAGASKSIKDRLGRTPLHAACEIGSLEVAKLLMKEEGAIEETTKGGSTPLALAVFNGHVALARSLIETGAAIDARDTEEYTPLHTACWMGNGPMVQLLLHHKADRNGVTKSGKTPLQLVPDSRRDEIALFFNEAEDPEKRSCQRRTS